METKIDVSLNLDIKLKFIDIIKLRLAGIKGQKIIDEFIQRIKAPTCVLVDDLAKREGVEEFWIEPHTEKYIISKVKVGTDPLKVEMLKTAEGAARILVVID